MHSRLPAERQHVPGKDRSPQEAAKEASGACLHERAFERPERGL